MNRYRSTNRQGRSRNDTAVVAIPKASIRLKQARGDDQTHREIEKRKLAANSVNLGWGDGREQMLREP